MLMDVPGARAPEAPCGPDDGTARARRPYKQRHFCLREVIRDRRFQSSD